jgi:hypothetical protein
MAPVQADSSSLATVLGLPSLGLLWLEDIRETVVCIFLFWSHHYAVLQGLLVVPGALGSGVMSSSTARSFLPSIHAKDGGLPMSSRAPLGN